MLNICRPLIAILATLIVSSRLRTLAYHSGASDEEVHGSLPGDRVIERPAAEWTRAATIEAPAEAIWPWLVQMGYDRGGWYTNERLDRLVWRVNASNADRVLPQYQDLRVGDIVADGPRHAAYFHVRVVERSRAIVYHSIRHPFRGHPLPDTEPTTLSAMEERLRREGSYLDFSWAFVLVPIDAARTRLIIRTRASYSPRSVRYLEVPLGWVDLFHAHTMLAGIRQRAEATIAASRKAE